jgi:hypothetical protein
MIQSRRRTTCRYAALGVLIFSCYGALSRCFLFLLLCRLLLVGFFSACLQSSSLLFSVCAGEVSQYAASRLVC